MKSSLIITSSKGNMYIYDFLKKTLLPINPLIALCYNLDEKGELDNIRQYYNTSDYGILFGNTPIEYYVKKYKMLKSNGYFQIISKSQFEEYTPETILRSLSSVTNIVFEITDACNLSCTYCINGSLYSRRESGEKRFLKFEKLKATIDYFLPLWSSQYNSAPYHPITIGFYGGEPLLNFKAIRKLVEYCKQIKLKRQFCFAMTTNATLLNKYITFLVENNFQLTISLDGDERGHSYRTFKNGENSFNHVYKILKDIMKQYPDFWQNNVSFNSVLHNRNNVNGIHDFIFREFNKIPEIHPLNNTGVQPEMQTEFNKMYRQYNISHQNSSKKLIQERFASDHNVLNLCKFLLWYDANQYYDYESLIYSSNTRIKSATGTCFPFSRKFYVTSKDEIMVCEKINSKYSLGKIKEDGILSLDFNYIAQKYNEYQQKMFLNCKSCYMLHGCSQCMFQLNNLESDRPICWMHKSQYRMIEYIRYYIDMLEENNVEYERVLNECVLS